MQADGDRINKRWIKALRISHDDTPRRLSPKSKRLKTLARVACHDAYHPDKFGGTGDSFDWDKILKTHLYRFHSARGLTVDNVGEAIAKTNVYGVDVSGGIESAKGVKVCRKWQVS